MIASATPTRSNWTLILFGLLAVITGGVVGFLSGFLDNPLIVVAGLLGLVAAAVVVVRVEWGLMVLVFFTYTRFSDVLVRYHNAPSIVQAFIPFLFMVILIRWYLYGARPRGWMLPIVLMAGYGLVGLASTLVAPNFNLAFSELNNFAKDALIAVLIVLLLQRGITLKRVIWTLLGVAIFLGTISTHQYLTGNYSDPYWGFGVAEVQQIVAGQADDYRIAGPVGDANFYAQILLPLIPLAIDRFFNEKKISRRIFAAWALLVCIITVMVTFSRGAFISMTVMLLIIFLMNRPKPSVVVATIGIFMVLVQFVPAQYTERLSTLLDFIPGLGDPNAVVQEASFAGRSNQMEVGVLIFADNPILGVGMGNSQAVFFEYSRLLGNVDSREARQIHNYYLEIAVERGLLGLIAFGILMFGVYRSVMDARKHLTAAGDLQYAGMVTALGIGLIGYFFAATFLHDAYNRYFWLLIGIALALPEVVKRKLASAKVQNPTQELKP